MRTAFDGSIRRRIHFFRHGDVSYVDKEGNRVPDSRAVPLTDWGREQAALMCDYVKELSFDKAVCSGLPRTVETAEGILKGRGLKIEVMSEFEEIRSDPDRYKNLKSLHDVAYAFEGAHLPGARYGEGESFLEFEARIVTGMMHLVADKSWQNLALIAHGGVNRAILGWASGASLGAFHAFDQNTCCLNIVDVDTHPDTGEIRRMTVRGMNITPYDPVKKNVDNDASAVGKDDFFRLPGQHFFDLSAQMGLSAEKRRAQIARRGAVGRHDAGQAQKKMRPEPVHFFRLEILDEVRDDQRA